MEKILVLAVAYLVSSSFQVQAGLGDGYSRQLLEVSEDNMTKDACLPFHNITNNQFFSPASPNNKETYPSNIDCVLILEAPPGHLIKLDFRDYFRVEPSPDCKNDYLEVRDGRHGYNKVLEHFCGIDVFPPIITSSDRHLWIQFKSDENIEYTGFKAVYEFIKRPEHLKTSDIPPCYIDLVDPKQGVLNKSYDIPEEIIKFDIEYDMPIDCLWTITVKENWKIYLQFDKFTLEKPNDCDSNFVQVFSNKTDMQSEEKKFCGSIADTVLSKSNKMFVRFYSLSKGPKTLFVANYTAYRDMGTSKNQKCGPQEFYCEDATCIHEDLKCDEKYNCRSRFDEEGCQSSPSMTWSGDHMIIIMVIFSLILTGMCITFIYNCITKLIRDHQTIQEYMRQSEQRLNDLDKQGQMDKKHPSKVGSQSRSHSSPSMESNRFDAVNAVNTPCYVPGGDILSILVRSEHNMSPSNGDAYNTNIYTVDNDNPPEMCDSACQTRESLFTTQGYSSGNSTPNHSVHTNSPPAPFSTFGYKKDNKFKAEAKIEMVPQTHIKYTEKRRPYSVQTTKSAPDVIVTH